MIELRSYLPGDETSLVEIFNNSLPGGVMRTEESWRWRYAKNPHFNPEGVMIAEVDGRIVGYLIATMRPLLFLGRAYAALIGDDFCLTSEARGKGIGAMLLDRLMKFSEERHALLMVYEGKDNLAHKMCTKRGWSTVDEFVTMRRERRSSVSDSHEPSKNQRVHELLREWIVRGCREDETDRAVTFLNQTNRVKAAAPELSRSEYDWRYLTFTNCSLNSVLLALEGERILGHAAITSHSGSEEPFLIVSDPSGETNGILKAITDRETSAIVAAIDVENVPRYESYGFKRVGRGVVVVRDYTGLNIVRSATAAGIKWYLFTESIFGEP